MATGGQAANDEISGGSHLAFGHWRGCDGAGFHRDGIASRRKSSYADESKRRVVLRAVGIASVVEGEAHRDRIREQVHVGVACE